MIAMVFEFWMRPDDQELIDEYHASSAEMGALMVGLDGFIGVERFESCSEPGKFVAVGFFDDEAAVERWRNTEGHRMTQRLGRSRYFVDYRLRMAQVLRDYGPDDRAQAPIDSNNYHRKE